MIRAVLIEDEPLAARKLQRLLTDIAPDIQILEVLDSVQSSISWLKEHPTPDLIFSDIQLGDGSSFRIFESVKVNCPVIFVTAYDSYAVRAFSLNSIDYLLKPVQQQELDRAVSRFRERYGKPVEAVDYSALLALLKMNGPAEYKKRFIVQVGERIKKVEVSDISYFIADGRYVHVVTNQGENLIVNHTLEELDGMLDPAVFFRANRKFIIHIKAVTGMLILSKSKIRIELLPKCEEECVVSSERSAEFKAWLNQ